MIASCFVGLKLKNAAHLLPFQNHGNVFMVDPAPVLCYPISSTDVRVLIDFPGTVAPNLTDEKLPLFLKNNVCPSLPLSMHEPFIKTIEEGNIRCALNREMPANLEFSKRGVIMLGDALNTRHPLTGGGMTVAFGDVQVLSELL
ncbi:Squalene epoxidase [compost metagenome]